MVTTNAVTAQDMKRIRSSSQDFVKIPASLPVSYKIGGKAYRGIPKEFSPVVNKRFLDSNIIEYVMKGKDPKTNIAITAECLEYLDFPVVEWTLWLENEGNEDTPVIHDLYAIDGNLPGIHPELICNNGDTTDTDIYTEFRVDLTKQIYFSQKPYGGRSCDCALPYYRVLCEDFGYNLSIGWSGQWVSEFERRKDGFHFNAKQQYTNFYLKAGEKIRTPRMTIMTFEGGEERGINMWRRWMRTHIVPKPNGRVIPPFISFSAHGDGEEHTLATCEQQIRAIDSFKASNLHPDVLWIDAGWYPCKGKNGINNWMNTGALYADPERFPNGLNPVGDKCHAEGMKFLLWFEPERVNENYAMKEYPKNALLHLKDKSVFQQENAPRRLDIWEGKYDFITAFNFADAESCDWLTNHIDGLIKEYGVDIYRQDCNFYLLPWWLQNDEENRQGVTENFYIQGLLRFWDELLYRNPGLFINSVSSGGRRSDLDMLRRSVPLHASDFGFGVDPVHEGIMTFAFTWTPFCGTFAWSKDNENGDYNGGTMSAASMKPLDNFIAHNTFAPAMAFVWNGFSHRCANMPDGAFAETEECKYFKKFETIWRKAANYALEGDFYLLKMTDRTNTCWHVLQFHNEEKNEGIVQAIRHARNNTETYTAHLRQINAQKIYVFESPEFDRSITISGKDLLEKGFEISIPKRSAEIWFYHAL